MSGWNSSSRPPKSREFLPRDISDKENVASRLEKKRKIGLPPQARKETDLSFRRHTIGKERPDASKEAPLNCVGRESLDIQPLANRSNFEPVDVDTLLQRKMTGKSKYDYKGRSEQMMEYIKELRLCIRNYQSTESTLLSDKGALQLEVTEQQKSHMETVSAINEKLAILEKQREEALENSKKLEGNITETEEKLEATRKEKDIFQKEIDTLKGQIENLNMELKKTKDMAESASQQVENLQEINAKVQQYNSSLQQYNCQLQSEAAKTSEEMAQIQRVKIQLMEELAQVKGILMSTQSQLTSAQSKEKSSIEEVQKLLANQDRVNSELTRAREEIDSLRKSLADLQTENLRYRECTGKSASDLEALSYKALALEENYASQSQLVATLRQQLEVGKQKFQLAELQLGEKQSSESSLQFQISELKAKLETAEKKVADGEIIRRKLHNTIQELKGNIRVFCRVRPITDEEANEDSTLDPLAAKVPSNDLEGKSIELWSPQGGTFTFNYDKVFGPEATQKVVFEEIEQLVQSALDGYKVCIFAYGQTGSGKTFTMLGNPNDGEHKGMIPRSLEKIFLESREMQGQGWAFQMQASMLEIYNENIRDLLLPTRASGIGAEWNSNGGNIGGKQFTVKHDPQGNTTVSDLTVVEVNNWNQVLELLSRAGNSRSVGKTAMNEMSSRSHCVFTLRIRGNNMATGQSINGVLNLIDLAGSERLSKSAATGDRLKETQAINKSLSSLGDVICAIANKEPHVPYRNSKLTYLLQPCLGGEAKTLMFVNIGPSKQSAHESLCSLRFAAKVNSCEIGVPKRNTMATRADSGKSGSVSIC